MKLPLLFACAVFVSMSASAQITITKHDVQKIFSAGAHNLDQPTKEDSIVIGVASASAQEWDFSGLAFDSPDTIFYVNPATQPGAALFPTANLANRQSPTDCTFFIVDDSGMFSMGSVSIGHDTTLLVPPGPLFEFPMTAGSTYTNRSIQYISTDTRHDTLVFSGTVDAWGTMKLAGGTHECLRMKYVQVNLSAGLNPDTSIYFLFVTRDGAMLEVDPVNIADASQRKVWANATYIHPLAASAVHASALNAREPQLQIYPNPVATRGDVVVRIDAPETPLVDLVNMLGEIVQHPQFAKSSDGVFSATLDATRLPSGMYSLRVLNGSTVQARSIAVMK